MPKPSSPLTPEMPTGLRFWSGQRLATGDFGLAVSLDRSRLTTEGMMVGTLTFEFTRNEQGVRLKPTEQRIWVQISLSRQFLE